MLQHKQEERELKRYEGDIVKKQHHLRRTMAEYENSKTRTIYYNCVAPGKSIYMSPLPEKKVNFAQTSTTLLPSPSLYPSDMPRIPVYK